MKIASLQQELQQNSYPGRGIVLGQSPDGNKVFVAYWIMGRSVCGFCILYHGKK